MKALLIVDVQKDFMPGGALAVPDGDKIVSYIKEAKKRYDFIVWTKDWHPVDHCSFKENGGIWPKHCVKESRGSELHKDLEVGQGEYVVIKGTDKRFDSYSAFKDEGNNDTGLAILLKNKNIDEVHICGLATEYCVKYTARDALNLGFKVSIMVHGTRHINEEDAITALRDLMLEGAALNYE